MTQTHADKCAAIVSLLGYIYAHLDHIPAAMETTRQEWISEPSPLDDPPLPPPDYDPGCRGRCWTCTAYYRSLGLLPKCPPDELWVRQYALLRKRYRIAELEQSLMRLRDADLLEAQCVWAVYVEPWPDPKTEPISRARRQERQAIADRGVYWLANDLQGDVLAPGDRRRPLPEVIVELRSKGFSYRDIQRTLGCSSKTVAAVCTGK